MTFDFNAEQLPPLERASAPVNLRCEAAGIANCVAWFFVAHLDDEERICTAPLHGGFARFEPKRTCWDQALQCIPAAPVEAGEDLVLEVSQTGNSIRWRHPSRAVAKLGLASADEARGAALPVADKHADRE